MGDEQLDAAAAAEAAEIAAEEAERLREAEPPPALAPGEFLAWRSPRLGDANPTRLDNPLWHWLVRTRRPAYSANALFEGPSSVYAGPMWCFDRFGRSETTLPDGRVVHIGGEHEDYYCSDFFIYNDVTVIGPDGSIAIHGYPERDFPPTDFHSATLTGDAVVIIGCAGYPDQRQVGSTPVHRLDLATMRIAAVPSTGEAPSWISRHAARLSDDGKAIVVTGGDLHRGASLASIENIDAWRFDLAEGRWTRLTALDWQRWTMRRIDGGRNRLWEARQALWERSVNWRFKSSWTFDDPPDLDAFSLLYRLDEGSPPAEKGSDHNVFRSVIDGVSVRFTEDSHSVQAIVEGRLSEDRLAALKRRTLALLERLGASPWEIEEP